MIKLCNKDVIKLGIGGAVLLAYLVLSATHNLGANDWLVQLIVASASITVFGHVAYKRLMNNG